MGFGTLSDFLIKEERMNDVLYRVWDEQAKQMITLTAGSSLEYSSDGHKLVFGENYHDDFCLGAKYDYTIMQSIPYKDKTGKVIFEGDIVAMGLTEQHTKSVVRIGEWEICIEVEERYRRVKYYGMYLEGSFGLEEYIFDGQMYVIGNIYEHPELVQGGR